MPRTGRLDTTTSSRRWWYEESSVITLDSRICYTPSVYVGKRMTCSSPLRGMLATAAPLTCCRKWSHLCRHASYRQTSYHDQLRQVWWYEKSIAMPLNSSVCRTSSVHVGKGMMYPSPLRATSATASPRRAAESGATAGKGGATSAGTSGIGGSCTGLRAILGTEFLKF